MVRSRLNANGCRTHLHGSWESELIKVNLLEPIRDTKIHDDAHRLDRDQSPSHVLSRTSRDGIALHRPSLLAIHIPRDESTTVLVPIRLVFESVRHISRIRRANVTRGRNRRDTRDGFLVDGTRVAVGRGAAKELSDGLVPFV